MNTIYAGGQDDYDAASAHGSSPIEIVKNKLGYNAALDEQLIKAKAVADAIGHQY